MNKPIVAAREVLDKAKEEQTEILRSAGERCVSDAYSAIVAVLVARFSQISMTYEGEVLKALGSGQLPEWSSLAEWLRSHTSEKKCLIMAREMPFLNTTGNPERLVNDWHPILSSFNNKVVDFGVQATVTHEGADRVTTIWLGSIS